MFSSIYTESYHLVTCIKFTILMYSSMGLNIMIHNYIRHTHTHTKKKRFVAKVVPLGCARKYDRVSPFFKELKCLRVKTKHIFDICTSVYKVLKRCCPESFLCVPNPNRKRWQGSNCVGS